jgi:hypothetical protein
MWASQSTSHLTHDVQKSLRLEAWKAVTSQPTCIHSTASSLQMGYNKTGMPQLVLKQQGWNDSLYTWRVYQKHKVGFAADQSLCTRSGQELLPTWLPLWSVCMRTSWVPCDHASLSWEVLACFNSAARLISLSFKNKASVNPHTFSKWKCFY